MQNSSLHYQSTVLAIFSILDPLYPPFVLPEHVQTSDILCTFRFVYCLSSPTGRQVQLGHRLGLVPQCLAQSGDSANMCVEEMNED